MTPDIKELVKRLRATMNWGGSVGVRPINQDGPEAADALEALAGEVGRLTNEVAKERGNADQNSMQRDKARAERDRLKAVLKPRLNAKAIEGLQEILEAMEAMDEREAPFLKTLLDWHEAAGKALGDAS